VSTVVYSSEVVNLGIIWLLFCG